MLNVYVTLNYGGYLKSKNYTNQQTAMINMIVIFWNYYFGSLDRLFPKLCMARVY